MKKLIPMTDFVLEQVKRKVSIISHMICIEDYANFLKQPLELWMFVPCDKEGNVLEEPKSDYKPIAFWNAGEVDEKTNDLYREYQEAKDRVLFEGFEVDYSSKPLQIIKSDCMPHFLPDNLKIGRKTVEHLVKYNLELTPAVIKQIGL
jgi:hypothetical protein